MVESKNKIARAKVAHKLAKYVRATPIHLTGLTGSANPSTSHISMSSSTQPWEEPPNADLETKLIPGTPLKMRDHSSRELAVNPGPLLAESLLPPEQSSLFFPESAEEEESLCSRPSLQETSSSLDPTPSTESPSEESTLPMSSPPPPKSPLKESTSMLMTPSSKRPSGSARTSLSTPHNIDLKNLKKERLPKLNSRTP